MRLLKPEKVTTATLISSTVGTTDYTVWNSGTTYAVGDYCYKGLYVYRATAISTNKDPETNAASADNLDWIAAGYTPSTSPVWIVYSMITKWKMFDSAINTQTVGNNIVVVLQPARALYGNVLNVECNSVKFEILNGSNASVWEYTRSFIDEQQFSGWYDWSFGEFPSVAYNVTVKLGWTVQAAQGEKVRITFYGTGAKVGKCFCSNGSEFALTEYGVTIGLYDTSKVVTNELGTTYLNPGKTAFPVSANLYFEKEQIDFVHRKLAQTRGTEYVWEFNNSVAEFSVDVLICYGVLTTLSTKIDSYNKQYSETQIKALI